MNDLYIYKQSLTKESKYSEMLLNKNNKCLFSYVYKGSERVLIRTRSLNFSERQIFWNFINIFLRSLFDHTKRPYNSWYDFCFHFTYLSNLNFKIFIFSKFFKLFSGNYCYLMARSYLSIETFCFVMFHYYIWLLGLHCSVNSNCPWEWSLLEYSEEVSVDAHTIRHVFQHHNGYIFSIVYIVQHDCFCLNTHLGQE